MSPLAHHIITTVFAVSSGAVVLLYVLCHTLPRVLVPHMSIPHVFQLRWNLGPRALELQSAVYLALHRNTFDAAVHALLVVDVVGWFVLVDAVAGLPGVAALGALLLVQAASFREPLLVVLLGVAWALVAVAALLAHRRMGTTAVDLAEIAVVAGAALRAVGHLLEPLPPVIGDDSPHFSPLRFRPRLLLTTLVGPLAEMAAGLPFRLLPVQLRLAAQRLGWLPRRLASLEQARARAARFVDHGWLDDETVRPLFADYPFRLPPAGGLE